MTAKLTTLQVQRDRFLAFAFAAADLLLEIDDKGQVAYASGATRKLLGRDMEDVPGSTFLDLFDPLDRGLVRAALRGMTSGGRLQTLNIRLAGADPAARAWMNGYRLPIPDGPIHIALSSLERFAERVVPEGPRDADSSLLEGEALGQALAEAAETGGVGQGDVLTLLEVEGLEGLSQRLAPAQFQGLMSDIGGFLRLQSGGRDLAGRLAEGRFGVLHDGKDGKALEAHIGALSRQADPEGNGLTVASRDIAMGLASLTASESARAIMHTLKQFGSNGLGAITADDLTTAFHDLLNSTLVKLADFKQILTRNDIDLAYQPIVDLKDGRVHHFELLTRFRDGRKTFEWISFGESLGMNGELDLLVSRRAIDDLATAFAGTKLSLAVNLSGNSLQDSTFTTTLLELLRDHQALSGRLLFEVTESAEIQDLAAVDAVLQQIRSLGFQVCLDDFGAGAASFQYLQALTVDYVKIDGAYVKRLEKSPRDRHMLSAMVALCGDLKVGVIAEMVETEQQAGLLRDLGVGFAQGYLYGKPAEEPVGFARRSSQVGRRAGARHVWT